MIEKTGELVKCLVFNGKTVFKFKIFKSPDFNGRHCKSQHCMISNILRTTGLNIETCIIFFFSNNHAIVDECYIRMFLYFFHFHKYISSKIIHLHLYIFNFEDGNLQKWRKDVIIWYSSTNPWIRKMYTNTKNKCPTLIHILILFLSSCIN